MYWFTTMYKYINYSHVHNNVHTDTPTIYRFQNKVHKHLKYTNIEKVIKQCTSTYSKYTSGAYK